MAIELRILSGARAGQTERFQQPVIAIGRHPASDLRFDPTRDLDVSSRHGSIHELLGTYAVQDAGSTNGTFVNGERLAVGVPRELHEGDVIAFGAQGPTMAVHLGDLETGRASASAPSGARVAPPAGASASTNERIAVAVRAQTRGLRIVVACAVIGLGGLAMVVFWMNRREAPARGARVEGVAEQQPSRRGHEVTPARSAMDLPALHQANDAAIVLISSDVGGQTLQATGFCVRASGLIVTNRHVVSDSTSQATRVLVKFADTPIWRPARVVKLDDDPSVDLALVQVDDKARRTYPTVRSIAGSVDIPVGAPIATLGFVLGTDLPMEGDGNDAVAKTTLTLGTVSKTVSDVLQIDSYASHGSSGSPVIDAHDHVIGVVYGGQPGTSGRIVFAVPVDRVADLLHRQDGQ